MKKNIKNSVYVTESLCYTAEITILYINHACMLSHSIVSDSLQRYGL